MSLLHLFDGDREQAGKSSFWLFPNGRRPPYLALPDSNKPDLYGDTVWRYLFRHKATGQVGVLMWVGDGSYWLDPPTMLSPRHRFGDNDLKKRMQFNGWDSVCAHLELWDHLEDRIYRLTGDESERFNHLDDIL
jgi:hypothetical protein